jgi:hypothetical protein
MGVRGGIRAPVCQWAIYDCWSIDPGDISTDARLCGPSEKGLCRGAVQQPSGGLEERSALKNEMNENHAITMGKTHGAKHVVVTCHVAGPHYASLSSHTLSSHDLL